jgi:uncharacterized protein YbjT (DUF2867 family)
MRVLVLGAYGLIGTHVVARLLASGHEVVGLGRDTRTAARRFPDAEWIDADLGTLLTAAAWSPILAQAQCEAIVNAAGLLQDGARDRVADVQSHAMQALYRAAPAHGARALVQISATRAEPEADTTFMRSKAEADAALAASGLEWTILRPGLVLAAQAYGGTALLRALAAMPLAMPIAFPGTAVQTVAATDVADAVAAVLDGRVPGRHVYDLVEETPHTLREVQGEMRRWLGRAPAREIVVPAALVRMVARVADGLGWLGWRSPFRSTAVVELAAGIRGDPVPWREAAGRPLQSLSQTLRRLPSTVQERWFARAFLVKPLAIGVLALFWVATGLTALAQPEAAAGVLTQRGVSPGVAAAIAVGGGLADIALGLGVLIKPALGYAAGGMIAMTLAYLIGGSVLAPDLWLDPLGPLLKAVPAMVLAMVVLALREDR